jgi:SAM-dependent methyltransferase
VLARSQSLHGLLEVIEDRNRGLRVLRADHSLLGARWNKDRTAAFSFLHILESIRFLRPASGKILHVGLGIGSLPMALQRWGFESDVVEIDPEVVRLARDHFDFSTTGRIYVEDGRALLQRLPAHSYDVIVHDTFTGGTTPEHLLSLEVLTRIHDVLRPGGLLTLNFLGYQTGPSAEASWAVMRTLRTVFSNVLAFRDMPPGELPDSVANLVFFASDEPLDFTIPSDATFENGVCAETLQSFAKWQVLNGAEPTGPIIRDDKNPLARLQLTIASEHYKLMNELMPAEIWLD